MIAKNILSVVLRNKINILTDKIYSPYDAILLNLLGDFLIYLIYYLL